MSRADALRVYELLHLARVRGASDLHLAPNEAATLRVDGRLERLAEWDLAGAELEAFLREALDEPTRRRLAADGNADAGIRHAELGPIRLHAYRARSGVRLAIRLLAPKVPALEELGLPPILSTLCERQSGLLLFTGPTGSGKSTALAALVDRINRTRERHVITIEDPVEYVHASLRSIVVHREIGADVASFADALRGAMRSDPDVIMLGELRDPPTMAAALTAAETGHLVLATLHTPDTAASIDRLVDAFPAAAQQQIRAQLALVLVAVVGVRLVPRAGGKGRRAAAEILLATDGVRAMIRDGKVHQLRNAIATGRAAGMQTLEAHLCELVAHGEIAREAALLAAEHPEEIRGLEPAVR